MMRSGSCNLQMNYGSCDLQKFNYNEPFDCNPKMKNEDINELILLGKKWRFQQRVQSAENLAGTIRFVSPLNDLSAFSNSLLNKTNSNLSNEKKRSIVGIFNIIRSKYTKYSIKTAPFIINTDNKFNYTKKSVDSFTSQTNEMVGLPLDLVVNNRLYDLFNYYTSHAKSLGELRKGNKKTISN